MFVDDIFDGWLAVSPVGSFLEISPSPTQSSPTQSSPASVGSHGRVDAAFDATRLQPNARRPDQLQTSVVTPSSYSSQVYPPSRDPSNTPTGESGPRKRRGHTKSRLGCITCKRRKIKCQEQWPSCANCIKRGCPCRYPNVFKYSQQERSESEIVQCPRPSAPLTSTPTIYSAYDMRLFHHFLIAAHPCVPLGYDGIWVRDIPLFSHQYEYLMHAMLALAGSHLSVLTDDPKCNMALSHRQKAITGLEEAFTRWPLKAEEAHAMLAASYLLAFQSSYMPDGFLDHILSLRGCALVSQMILQNHLEGAFSVAPNLHNASVEQKLRNFPGCDQLLLRDALRSLHQLAPLLAAATVFDIERAVFAQLVETLRPLLTPLEIPAPADGPPTPNTTESASAISPSYNHYPTSESSPKSKQSITYPLHPDTDNPAPALESTLLNGPESLTVVPDQAPDPYRSFNALMSSVLILATWPQGSVLHLFSSSNKLGNVILAHSCAIRFIVSPLSAPDSAMRQPVKAMVDWLERTIDAVEDDEEREWARYIEWPKRILKTLRFSLAQKPGLVFGDVYDILMNDPAAFREGRGRKL